MESRSRDALEVEFNGLAEGWKMGVPIGYPCDVMEER
jgi:hypothetical protein